MWNTITSTDAKLNPIKSLGGKNDPNPKNVQPNLKSMIPKPAHFNSSNEFVDR